MPPTDTVPENEPALDSSIPKAGNNTVPMSAVPSHVRHISKQVARVLLATWTLHRTRCACPAASGRAVCGRVRTVHRSSEGPKEKFELYSTGVDKGGSGDYTRDPSQVLTSDATKAINMVRKMAAEPTEGTPKASKNALIPLDYLKRCKGIQFVITRLGGLFVSVERGHSFVIQRLEPHASGQSRWSGPCFGTISNFGLGLTAGFDALDTIVILGNQTTVDKLKKGDAKFGVDIDLIVGKESALAQTDANWTEAETAAIPFTLAGGALFDVSFKGGAHTINHRKNKAIYGPEATPDAILTGALAPPAEFAPLYDLINKLAAAAPEELDDPLLNGQ